MDALLSPIRVNPPEAAGLYPARSPVGYALFRKRTAVLATSRERAADMYRSATVQNGTQWNIDGEELCEKQLPHLALDTLSEVIEKLIEALRRVGANIYLYTHACSFFHNVKQVSRDFGIHIEVRKVQSRGCRLLIAFVWLFPLLSRLPSIPAVRHAACM